MLDENKIKELKEKHGEELSLVEGPLGDLVFRKPTRAEYDRWYDKAKPGQVGSAQNYSMACRELCKACLVLPGEEDFNKAIEHKPAILTIECVNAVTGMAGLDDKFAVKKL